MFLALDQGTTSSRAIVFAEDGAVRGLGQCEFGQHFPQPGQVEHDADEIVASQLRAAELACERAGNPGIVAAGITNQRETVVVFERATGRPIHRAIVWQDRRTAPELAALAAAGHADLVRQRTGLSLDPYFSAAKIAWILDHVPGARTRAERGELGAATIDAWLVYRLTRGEVFATEPSNAARTCLFDLATGDWCDELCELFAVPRACLPEIRSSADDFGTATGHGWPLRAVLGDQQAALFGHACIAPGDRKCTYGTGAFVLTNAGRMPPAPVPGVLSTVAWRLGGETTFAREGSVLVCGAAVQWLRDQLGILDAADAAEAMARSVRDSGGVVFVPAFTGLGTPHWDPTARGAILGLSRGSSRAHIVRAVVEAMALQVDEVLAAMGDGDGIGSSELHVDGGAAANRLLLEIQATLLGTRVVRPALLEATAFGAFRMSLLGAGVHAEPSTLPRLPGRPEVVEPDAAIDPTALRAGWQRALPRSLGWS
ncbi:MAG: glycerol kinase GlpK [Planctomycetes bacterium]|nr:glycerol kinase GlpK [Planctomycetota bacterium]